MGRTLAEKVWDEHVVRSDEGEPDLLYIDLHLVHEVTSPQAFDGLRLAGRTVRHPELTLATEDHNVPTLDWDKPIADPVIEPTQNFQSTAGHRRSGDAAGPQLVNAWRAQSLARDRGVGGNDAGQAQLHGEIRDVVDVGI